MLKRTQKESGEERVTAKSRQMMSLIARSSERHPSAVSFTASESTWKTRQESQSPLSAQAEMYDTTGKPVVCRDTSHERHRLVEKAHSSSYSECNIDKTWSTPEWKSDELMDDRTGRPVVCPQGGAHTSQTRFSREHKNVILEEEENHDRTGRLVVCPQRGAPQHFVIEDDEAKSDLSLGSRSFLHRVNDQVRKRQKQSSMDATEDSEEHSVIWRMFMSSTLQASVFIVKNYSDNWHSIKNTEDLTMKQMFDISEKLITEQSDEIYGRNTINWEDSSWKYLSLIGDEQLISLQRT